MLVNKEDLFLLALRDSSGEVTGKEEGEPGFSVLVNLPVVED